MKKTNSNLPFEIRKKGTSNEELASQLAEKATKLEVQNIGNASPKGVYATLTALQTAFPTGTTGIYLVTADGKWYYWSGSVWTAGGTYQSTGIADGAITPKKTSYMTVLPSINLLNMSTFMKDYQLYSDGSFGASAGYYVSPPVPVEGLSNITVLIATGALALLSARYAFYNSLEATVGMSAASTFSTGGNDTSKVPATLTVPVGAKYFRFHMSATYYNTMIASSLISQVQSGTSISSYPPYGDTVTNNYPSSEVISARGNFPTLKERLDNVVKILDYWGDSLTQGNQDGSGKGRPSVMKTLLGSNWTVNNWGVGGETSNTIACRQGGMNLMAKAGLIIPADTTAVDTTGYLFDMNGNVVNLGNGIYSSAYNAWDTVNPCYINGVKGNLTKANSGSPIMFTRLTAGTQVTITRPSPVTTNSVNFKNRCLIIFIGQNQGFNTSDPQELVNQIKYMIDFNGYNKYLVIGLCHSKNPTYSWQVAVNAALKKEFGRHFIDIETYMKTPIYDTDGTTIISSYAMSDAGLTPISTDLTNIANNVYPTPIMYDGIHFNQYGYTVIANLEYKRGQELGYW